MEICQLFLSYGFDGHGYAIGSAARMGKRDFFHLLLDAGENIHGPSYSKGNTLCAVALGGHDDIVHILLERNVNVNVNLRSDEGTPLEIAVRQEKYSTCKILIENGADTSVLKNSQHKKILGSACHALASITPDTHKEIVRLTVLLHVGSSKQSVLDLMNKAEDWLKPYYMNEMGSRL